MGPLNVERYTDEKILLAKALKIMTVLPLEAGRWIHGRHVAFGITGLSVKDRWSDSMLITKKKQNKNRVE